MDKAPGSGKRPICGISFIHQRSVPKSIAKLCGLSHRRPAVSTLQELLFWVHCFSPSYSPALIVSAEYHHDQVSSNWPIESDPTLLRCQSVPGDKAKLFAQLSLCGVDGSGQWMEMWWGKRACRGEGMWRWGADGGVVQA